MLRMSAIGAILLRNSACRWFRSVIRLAHRFVGGRNDDGSVGERSGATFFMNTASTIWFPPIAWLARSMRFWI